MQKTSRPYTPSHRRTLSHRLAPAAALLAVMLAATSAQAASQTWTNSASDSLWNTTSLDWTGAAWTNNNDAVFGATGVGSIAVDSAVIVNDITFSTAGYTLTGNLMLANDQASTFTATQNATISAIIANNTAGASSLTKAGANTLTLSGANTYTGGTTLNAGTVSVGNDAAFGTGAVTIGGASTVTNTTNVTLANNFTTTALPTFTSSGGTMALNGNITGGQGVTLNATNKITLAGTNNIATTTTGTNTFFGLSLNAGAGGVDITGSTTVGTPGAGGTSFNGGMGISGTTTLTIQSGGSLTVNGSGTTATNTPNSSIGQNTVGTSTILVNGGSLTIGASSGLLLGNGNNNNIASNGTLTIASGTATINRGSVGTTTNGTDTRLIMMGRDSTSATGTINLNGGTLATDRQFVRDGSSTGQSGTANFVFGGGTLKALGAQTDWLQSTTATSGGQGGGTVNANALALSSVTTTAVSTIDSNGFSVAINNAISGAGGFNIISSSGNGTVIFGGANTYTGNTTITSGTLKLGSSAAVATFLADSSSLFLTTGSLLNLSFADNSVMESIAGLYIDGVQQAAGTWGAVGSGAANTTALITGTGLLNVSAIPEPATYAALAGVLALGAVITRRRRSAV
jgi:autotransporter-associated beta strand protein